MPLDQQTIQRLSAATPPNAKALQARIAELEQSLGLPASPKTFEIRKLQARVAELEQISSRLVASAAPVTEASSAGTAADAVLAQIKAAGPGERTILRAKHYQVLREAADSTGAITESRLRKERIAQAKKQL